MSHSQQYFQEVDLIGGMLRMDMVELLASYLSGLRGTLWTAGLGGSAANASHAASDFRRLCGIDARCLTDSVAGFTAAANDEGWDNALCVDFKPSDGLLIFSVGGGSQEVSRPIVTAIAKMQQAKGKVFGIVGRDGGYTAKHADVCVTIPTVNEKHVTPHTEAFQMVVLHCLVSHPLLQKRPTKW